MQQEILVCGWLCSAYSTRTQSPTLDKFGKVVFCEVALCPGMRWVKRVSSRQQDLRFVPLTGARHTAGECCFSCGFPSLSWVRAESWSTKEEKSKQPPKGRVKAQRMQGRTCFIAMFLPQLWHSSVPRRGWEVLLFPNKFRKIQP